MNQQPESYQDCLQRFTQAIEFGEGNMAIYKNNILGLHSQALCANFQVTRQALGEDNFDALSKVYSQHFPANQWDVNLYGEQFADFIHAQTNGPRGKHCDFISAAALALLEYAIVVTYYAVDNNDDTQTKVGHQQLPGLPGAEFTQLQFQQLTNAYAFCQFPRWWTPSQPAELCREGIAIKFYQGSLSSGEQANND